MGHHIRQILVALVFDRVHRVNTAGAAGIARNKNHVVFDRAVFGPLQEVFDLCRLVVFVDSKNTGIQTITRILKVVRITSEEGNRCFRSPHQSHVCVLFVLVQVVSPAAVQSGHCAFKARCIQCGLFNLRDNSATSSNGLFGCHAVRNCSFDIRRDILDGDQLVEFEIRSFELLIKAVRQEPCIHDIPLGCGQLVERVRTNVMIREHEA